MSVNVVTSSTQTLVSSDVTVGLSPTNKVGFYGAEGVAQQSGTGITTVAGLVAALQALGLLA